MGGSWFQAMMSSCHPLLTSAGGFFDGSTSAEERQRYLLDTIRASTAPADSSGQRGGEQLSDGELNQLLARGDAELELLEAEDARLRVGGWAVW